MLTERFEPCLDDKKYHNDPCPTPSLSASVAKVLLQKTPKHAWLIHPKLGGEPWEPNEAMEHGDIIHAGVLGEKRELVIPKDESGEPFQNYRKAEARRQRDEARAEGRLPVLDGDYARLKLAIQGVRERLEQLKISLEPGHCEVSAFWGEDGVQCRGRFDLFEGGIWVTDLKTSRSIPFSDTEAQRKIVNMGWDVQAAAYASAVERLIPELRGRVRMRWLFCENRPPFSIVQARASNALMEMGRAKWKKAVKKWGECLADDTWPRHPAPLEIWPSPWDYRDATGFELLEDQ